MRCWNDEPAGPRVLNSLSRRCYQKRREIAAAVELLIVHVSEFDLHATFSFPLRLLTLPERTILRCCLITLRESPHHRRVV